MCSLLFAFIRPQLLKVIRREARNGLATARSKRSHQLTSKPSPSAPRTVLSTPTTIISTSFIQSVMSLAQMTQTTPIPGKLFYLRPRTLWASGILMANSSQWTCSNSTSTRHQNIPFPVCTMTWKSTSSAKTIPLLTFR